MLGQAYFDHDTLRTLVAVFGSLFDDIYIVRKKANNDTLNQQKVPISFSPKNAFLGRLDERENLSDTVKAITYPRIGFEIAGGFTYDSSRQTGSRHCSDSFNTTDNSQRDRLYRGVPYNIPISLYIVSENRDDADQIVEQILPFFSPSLQVNIKPLNKYSSKADDWKFVLNSVSLEDSYNTDFTKLRQVIYTLSFTASIWFYRSAPSREVIKEVIVNINDQQTENLIESTKYSVTPLTAEKEDIYTVTVTTTYGYDD